LVLGALLWLQWLLMSQYPARPVEQRLPLLFDSTRLCCYLLLTRLLLIFCLAILLLLWPTCMVLLAAGLPQPATYAALAIIGGCTSDVATAASIAIVAVLVLHTSGYVCYLRLHRL
jgi:hypothetical protein